MEENKNYYQILEVQTNANQDEISSAYTRARNAYSGDSIAMYSLLSQDDCKEILENIEEAYSILGDPHKREQYDKVKGITANSSIDTTKRQESFPENNNTSYLDETVGQASNERASNLRYEDRDPVTYDRYKSITKSENTGVSKVEALKKFRLSYDINEEFEQQIDNCLEFSGDFLKKIREYKKVSVERLAEMTKISKQNIRHIEEEAYDKLPAAVYLRGFIYQYAKSLKLNTDFVASSYMKRYQINKSS